jgi:hypothetical protein
MSRQHAQYADCQRQTAQRIHETPRGCRPALIIATPAGIPAAKPASQANGRVFNPA